MSLYIRTDGNSRTGSGHLMRCLSIADAAAALGIRICFLCADEQSIPLIQDRGYDSRLLQTGSPDLCAELPMMEKLLKEDKEAFLLADSYEIGNSYLKAAGNWSKTAYLDDFGERAYDVDLIINYNIYGPELPYRKLYAGKRTKLLLGSSYAPLRRDFLHTEYAVREAAEHILITTGGADRYRAAGRLAERLIQKTGGVRIHIVSGPFHEFRKELEQFSMRYPEVVLHENVTDMAGLMASCDLAVSAAGSTLYELCAVGVPTVYFSFVENQELPSRYFAEKTDMRYAGNYAQDAEGTLDRLTEECMRMLQSSGLRRGLSERMKKVTDGRGAQRIAEVIRGEMVRQPGV